MSDESVQTTFSEWLSTPVGQTKYGGRRHFAKGVSGSTKTFAKRGWKGLQHEVSQGYLTSSSGVNQRLRFGNQGTSEAASDDFLELNNITDDLFTEVLDGNNSAMIARIEYAPTRLLLRVTFVEHGSVVLYDHVPMTVFAELKHIADSGGSLGARFWDLIREGMRGGLPIGGPYYPKLSTFTREDSKYPYTTLNEGYARIPTVDGRKVDFNRLGTEYKRNRVNPNTGEMERLTGTEIAQEEEKFVETQARQMQREGRKASEDVRLQQALEQTARIKAEREAQKRKPTSYLGFRQSYLPDRLDNFDLDKFFEGDD